MAKKKKKELRDQSVDDLKASAHDLDQQLFKMRNELSVQRKVDKPHLIKEMRKNKARILTFLTQKQKGIA